MDIKLIKERDLEKVQERKQVLQEDDKVLKVISDYEEKDPGFVLTPFTNNPMVMTFPYASYQEKIDDIVLDACWGRNKYLNRYIDNKTITKEAFLAVRARINGDTPLHAVKKKNMH